MGSKNWHDKNFIVTQSVGEDLQAVQSWDDGNRDFLQPFAQIEGTAECIAQGEPIAEAITGQGYWSGLPHGCFVHPVLDEIPAGRTQAIDSPSAQVAYARCIELLYADDQATLTLFFKSWLGLDWNLFFYDPATPLPGVCVVTNGQACVVLVEGTTDFQQFAMQAYYGLGPPENIGIVRTSRFWYDAATYIIGRIGASGVTFNMPRVLVGHSYGAVAVAVAAARLRYAAPSVQTRTLMFASPKPGDHSVPGLLAGDYINIVNDGDVVPCVPFGEAELATIVSTIPIAVLQNWLLWRYMTKTNVLDTDGSMQVNTSPNWPSDLILDSVTNALLGNPIPAVTAHRIATYVANLQTRAPIPQWPLNAFLYAILGL